MDRCPAVPRRVGRRRTDRAGWAVLAAAALLVGLAAPAWGAAQVPTAHHAASVHATPALLPPAGGRSELTVAAKGATHCELATVPVVRGGSRRVPCDSGAPVSIVLPTNAAPAVARYVVTLTATGVHGTWRATAGIAVEGEDWHTTTTRHATTFYVSSLSCPAVRTCVEVTYDGHAALLDATGAHWADPDDLPLGQTTILLSVSCAPGGSPIFCVALDQEGNYVAFNGSTWTAPVPLYEDDGVTALPFRVDCMSLPAAVGGDQCVMADTTGHVYVATFQATTTVVAADVPLTGPSEVGCATPALCVVVDAAGDAAVLSNGSWSTSPTVLDRSRGVVAVSCAPDHACVAVDSHGNLIDFDLRASTVTGITVHTTLSVMRRALVPSAVSCSMRYCLVTYKDGRYAQEVHGTWHEAASTTLEQGDYAIGVSCTSSATLVWCASSTEGAIAHGSTTITSALTEGPVVVAT